ncbi:hypothetical protein FRX31_023738 [Thalictrum thalictroides]|uniref:Uncharacterized protein n=1 Tax=Thalictrum thalictroides TaxID=46969 RepID=A0A7J6VR18_THATH|nr:hypothetical protein FRX31_023738 [Thalictrum thalictroides]
MEPVSIFRDKFKFSRYFNIPNFEGISPLNIFWLRSRTCWRETKLPNSDGMLPLNLLFLKFKYNNLEQSTISLGISPLKLFTDKSKVYRPLNLPNSFGRFPSRLLPLKLSFNKVVKLPSSLGISPIKLFIEISRFPSFFKPFNPLGIRPVMLL